jgi:hypothetical protein
MDEPRYARKGGLRVGDGSAGPGTSAPSFQQFQPIAAFSISLKFQALK